MSADSENNSVKPAISRLNFGIGLLVLLLPIFIYYPGLNGPFIFDDLPNIVYNTGIQITQISAAALNEAAHSLHSGQFGRPLAGISFAINYFLAEGTENTFGYKVFNLVIHIINGLLVFWLVSLIFTKTPKLPLSSSSILQNKKIVSVLAGICAILWVVHPIQLTSVLYVVQRMTTMSAMFILAALICYIYARSLFAQGKIQQSLLWALPIPLLGVFSLFSKETALLLPLYIILFEFFLFKEISPWNKWHTYSVHAKRFIYILIVTILITVVFFAFEYANARYVIREFSMLERILTETRILIYYIGQTFIPRLTEFGLYHDDIVISQTLFSPWTTLPSIIILAGSFIYAIKHLKNNSLIAFGILWFFISHALESTIFPLEIVHEHRNYLASLGIILIFINGWILIYNKIKYKAWVIPALVIIFLCFITNIRSTHWKTLASLMDSQTYNHPNSPRAWSDLASIQIRNGLYNNGIASQQKAILLEPGEPGHYLHLYLYSKEIHQDIADQANKKLVAQLATTPESFLLTTIFHRIDSCIETSCKDMQPMMEKWLRTSLNYTNSPRYKYYLGSNLSAQNKLDDAMFHLNQSINEGGPGHPSPYIEKISVLIKKKMFNEAENIFEELQLLNQEYKHLNSSIIAKINSDIQNAKKLYRPSPIL